MSRQSSPGHWGLRGSAAAVGVAAVIAAIGGAAIYAATGSSSHSFVPGGGMAGGPRTQHGAISAAGASAVGSTSLHGEFVVPDGGGSYRTEVTQTGVLTAVSPTSITVRSEDGYSQTYVIPDAAITAHAPLAVDERVVLHATRKGQTATVTTIGNPPS